jgi:hypothetical protein
MIIFYLLLLPLSQSQVIDMVQYNSLMAVYTAAACSTVACPRFRMGTACSGPLTCVASNVVNLNLSALALSGSISSEIGRLSFLTSL